MVHRQPVSCRLFLEINSANDERGLLFLPALLLLCLLTRRTVLPPSRFSNQTLEHCHTSSPLTAVPSGDRRPWIPPSEQLSHLCVLSSPWHLPCWPSAPSRPRQVVCLLKLARWLLLTCSVCSIFVIFLPLLRCSAFTSSTALSVLNCLTFALC